MKYFSTVVLALLLAIGFSSPVYAGPPEGKGKKNKSPKVTGINKGKQRVATRHARNAHRWLLSKFQKALLKASGETLLEIAARYSDDVDSDEDTLPDWLELAIGTSACNSDSDGDGIADNEEFDDDELVGGEDDEEVEVENLIQELTDSTIVVGGITFNLDENTEWSGDDDTELSPTDFSVGNCVEVEGEEQEDSSILAEEVELKELSSCEDD